MAFTHFVGKPVCQPPAVFSVHQNSSEFLKKTNKTKQEKEKLMTREGTGVSH